VAYPDGRQQARIKQLTNTLKREIKKRSIDMIKRKENGQFAKGNKSGNAAKGKRGTKRGKRGGKISFLSL